MILAHCPLPKLEIPDEVRQAATGTDIATHRGNVPFGADVWLACPSAWPHVDDSFRGQTFLTLTIVGEHRHYIGDAKYPRDQAIWEGCLFVVAPLTAHWLAPLFPSKPPEPWIGVQWEMPCNKAKAKAREIVAELGGRWVETTDRRYAGWRPAA